MNIKAQKRYILPISPEAPSGWICTKFGLGGPLTDVINCAEFCGNGSGVAIVLGVKICHFPLTWPVANNAVLALPHSL